MPFNILCVGGGLPSCYAVISSNSSFKYIKCTLININDEITYIQKSYNEATSVINLTFVTRLINDCVVN